MKYRFKAGYKPSKKEWEELTRVVAKNHKRHFLSFSIMSFRKAKSVKLFVVKINNKIVSFAFAIKRVFILKKKKFKGFSLGLVTTKKMFQKRGIGTYLIKNIEKYSNKKKLDFLYLQGKKNFYEKFGFKGFAFKRKFIFYKKNIPKKNGYIKKLQYADIPKIKTFYNNVKAHEKCSVYRMPSDWIDLTKKLTKSFLFYHPKLIFSESKKCLGYFCTCPDDRNRVREFVPLSGVSHASSAISILSHHKSFQQKKLIEIFASDTSDIAKVAKTKIPADFLCFFRPKSGNMIKILNPKIKIKNIYSLFIYQGDNL